MIELDAVWLSYRDRAVIRGVSLALCAGALTVVVGPNGAGKSSLLKLMTGEVAPTRGAVRLESHDLRAIPPAGLALRRAVLPQSSSLAFPFTVGEVVRFGLDAGDGRGGADAIAEALARVDLTGFGGRLYGELSGGEQQRVHLARVLCQIGRPVGPQGPRFLFLDEPVSSLDIRHQLGVLKIARDFARAGGGVLAVLHDLNLASAFADRLVAVDDGRIVADGPPAAVLSDSLMEAVFGVAIRVGIVPPPGIPFILPQLVAADMGD